MRIQLNYSRIVRLGNTEPFIVPENLILEFESTYKLDKLLVVVKQNDKTEKFVIVDKKVDLSKFTKQAGIIEISVSLICDGKIAKQWEIEPLTVVELDGNFQIKEYYQEIINIVNANTDNITTAINKINEFIENHNELAMTVHEIKENY